MAAISQTIFSDAFSWMKSVVFGLKFHWSLFLRVQLTKYPTLVLTTTWHRIGDKPLSEPKLTQFTDAQCSTRERWVNVASMWQGRWGSQDLCVLVDSHVPLSCRFHYLIDSIILSTPCQWPQMAGAFYGYHQTSNIRFRHALVGNKIVHHSDVVGACRRCSNYIFILDLTPGFNRLCKDNCKTRRETFKFCKLLWLILEVWRCVL